MQRPQHGWFTRLKQRRIVLISGIIILIAGLVFLDIKTEQPSQSSRQFSNCSGCAEGQVIPDKNIYTIYTNNLLAQLFTIDPHTGKPLHDTMLVADMFNQQTILNGIAYGEIGSFTVPTQLAAIRLSDNRLLWEYDAGSHIINIAMATPGMIYVIRDNSPYLSDGKTDGNNSQTTSLLALNAANGKVVWQYDFAQKTDHLLRDNDTIITWNETAPDSSSSSSSGQMNSDTNEVTNNVLTVTALRADNGSVLWSHDLQDTRDNIFAAIQPVAVNHQLFVAFQPDQDHSQIVEFNDQNGQTLWQGQVVKTEEITSLAIAAGNLVITTDKRDPTNTQTISPTATLYVRPLAHTAFTWSYTATTQQSDLRWTIINDTAYALWSVVDTQTFAQHRVIAAWHISNGQKLWQVTTNMTNKFVNLKVFPNQIILNDPQGVDVEDRQLSTGALVWHIKIPQQNQVHTNKLQNTTISEGTLSTSVVTPSEYVEVTSDAVENAGYGLSLDAQKAQAAIYVATHINKTNNSDTNNTNGSSDIDRLYALDARTGHILWQRDPSTLYRDVQSDQPDPTPQPTVKAILHPTHDIHDFTNFVGTWNSHNGYLLFKANGDAQLYIKPQGCQGGPGCEEKNAITGIHFNRAEGNKAFGDVTTASADYKTGTTIVATLQDNDTLSIDKVGFDFCGPKSPPGYCGA